MTRPRTTLRRLATVLAVVMTVLTGLGAQAATAARPPAPGGLPRLHITGDYVTGISSGGYMATQLQVAWSGTFRGAGVFSAGPYLCAQDSLAVALANCTNGGPPPPGQLLYAETDALAAQGRIDPTSDLARIPTYFFHGTADPTVITPVADGLADFYRHYAVPLTYRNTLPAGHAWISPLGPVACGDTAAPYINDCPGYDAEADLLRTVFGSVKAPAATPGGTVTPFSQDAYAVPAVPGNGDPTRSGAVAIGMGTTGYLYTPRSCTTGTPCRLVVALHGCEQTAEQIGTTFVQDSGLNAYADTNRFVVLYPQARPDSTTIVNPKGCWDWWGYLGPGDTGYATKSGPQMRTVMAMVHALGG
jgi:poly(3-hydroxybutyrate) depolymerase